jgi:hypothetical protein
LREFDRVDIRRDLLEKFACSLSLEDIVVVEATGNASAVSAVIAPHVKRVAIANPKQVKIIAHAKIKTDTIDAGVLAQLYASGFLPEVWVPGDRGAAPPGQPPPADRQAAVALEEHHSVDPACPSDPALSGGGFMRDEGTGLAVWAAASGR